MTVSASSTKTFQSGNGIQTVFPFTYKCFQSTDLDVYIGVTLQASGYSVLLNTDFSGGSVVFGVAPITGVANVGVVRKSDLDQNYAPQEQQPLDKIQLGQAFDKTVLKIQENSEEIGRSLRIPVTSQSITTLLPAPTTEGILRWNTAANAIEYVDSATIVTEGGGGGGGGGSGITSIGMVVPTDVLDVSPSSLSAPGTFTITKVSQAQNSVAAGPTSGSGAWTFRALVEADIPSLNASKIGAGAMAKARQHAATVYNDQSNTYSGTGTQDFSAATQTVVLPLKTTPGSPVDGEIWVESTNLKFQDDGGTTRNVINDSFQISTTSPLTGGGALTSNLTIALGTVPIANGGTNITSYTDGDLLVVNSSGALVKLPLGTNGQFLTVNTGSNPKFGWVTGGSGVTSVDMTVPSVFAVSGNPITSTGTLAVTFAGGMTQNRVLASPDGSAGAVALRALVAADLPTVPINKGGTNSTSLTVTAGAIARGNGTALAGLGLGTAGQILRVNAGETDIEWFTSGGGLGTVTSVGLGLPAGGELTNTGTASPITTSGTYTLAWATQTTNKVFAAPDGSTGTPTFRVLATGDIPSLAASKITSGTFAEARGGTNISTYSTGDILYASGANTLAKLAAGTNGHVLTLAAGIPSWAAAAAGGGLTWNSSQTGNFTAVISNGYPVSTAGGAVVCTLPTAVGQGGKEIVVSLRTAGNNLTINTTSSQTIDGQASGAIVTGVRYNTFRFMSDDANWMLM